MMESAMTQLESVKDSVEVLNSQILAIYNNGETEDVRVIANDAERLLVGVTNSLSKVEKRLQGDVEEPTAEEKFLMVKCILSELLDIIGDELSLTDNVEKLSGIYTTQDLVCDAQKILDRAELQFGGHIKDGSIRCVLSTFGEYFVDDWTATERRITGIPESMRK